MPPGAVGINRAERSGSWRTRLPKRIWLFCTDREPASLGRTQHPVIDRSAGTGTPVPGRILRSQAEGGAVRCGLRELRSANCPATSGRSPSIDCGRTADQAEWTQKRISRSRNNIRTLHPLHCDGLGCSDRSARSDWKESTAHSSVAPVMEWWSSRLERSRVILRRGAGHHGRATM